MDHTQCLVKTYIIKLFRCMYTKRNILEDVNCTPGHGSLLQTSAGYHAFMPAVNAFMQAIARYAGCQRVHAGCQFSPTSSWCGLGPSVRTVLMLTGERLCQNSTMCSFTVLLIIIVEINMFPAAITSWIAPACQKCTAFHRHDHTSSVCTAHAH